MRGKFIPLKMAKHFLMDSTKMENEVTNCKEIGEGLKAHFCLYNGFKLA
jgi:hypothetical protein